MKKIDKWAEEGTAYMYDISARDAVKEGMLLMRKRIYELVMEEDLIMGETLLNHPESAKYLLLELANKIKQIGEEDDTNK